MLMNKNMKLNSSNRDMRLCGQSEEFGRDLMQKHAFSDSYDMRRETKLVYNQGREYTADFLEILIQLFSQLKHIQSGNSISITQNQQKHEILNQIKNNVTIFNNQYISSNLKTVISNFILSGSAATEAETDRILMTLEEELKKNDKAAEKSHRHGSLILRSGAENEPDFVFSVNDMDGSGVSDFRKDREGRYSVEFISSENADGGSYQYVRTDLHEGQEEDYEIKSRGRNRHFGFFRNFQRRISWNISVSDSLSLNYSGRLEYLENITGDGDGGEQGNAAVGSGGGPWGSIGNRTDILNRKSVGRNIEIEANGRNTQENIGIKTDGGDAQGSIGTEAGILNGKSAIGLLTPENQIIMEVIHRTAENTATVGGVLLVGADGAGNIGRDMFLADGGVRENIQNKTGILKWNSTVNLTAVKNLDIWKAVQRTVGNAEETDGVFFDGGSIWRNIAIKTNIINPGYILNLRSMPFVFLNKTGSFLSESLPDTGEGGKQTVFPFENLYVSEAYSEPDFRKFRLYQSKEQENGLNSEEERFILDDPDADYAANKGKNVVKSNIFNVRNIVPLSAVNNLLIRGVIQRTFENAAVLKGDFSNGGIGGKKAGIKSSNLNSNNIARQLTVENLMIQRVMQRVSANAPMAGGVFLTGYPAQGNITTKSNIFKRSGVEENDAVKTDILKRSNAMNLIAAENQIIWKLPQRAGGNWLLLENLLPSGSPGPNYVSSSKNPYGWSMPFVFLNGVESFVPESRLNTGEGRRQPVFPPGNIYEPGAYNEPDFIEFQLYQRKEQEKPLSFDEKVFLRDEIYLDDAGNKGKTGFKSNIFNHGDIVQLTAGENLMIWNVVQRAFENASMAGGVLLAGEDGLVNTGIKTRIFHHNSMIPSSAAENPMIQDIIQRVSGNAAISGSVLSAGGGAGEYIATKSDIFKVGGVQENTGEGRKQPVFPPENIYISEVYNEPDFIEFQMYQRKEQESSQDLEEDSFILDDAAANYVTGQEKNTVNLNIFNRRNMVILPAAESLMIREVLQRAGQKGSIMTSSYPYLLNSLRSVYSGDPQYVYSQDNILSLVHNAGLPKDEISDESFGKTGRIKGKPEYRAFDPVFFHNNIFYNYTFKRLFERNNLHRILSERVLKTEKGASEESGYGRSSAGPEDPYSGRRSSAEMSFGENIVYRILTGVNFVSDDGQMFFKDSFNSGGHQPAGRQGDKVPKVGFSREKDRLTYVRKPFPYILRATDFLNVKAKSIVRTGESQQRTGKTVPKFAELLQEKNKVKVSEGFADRIVSRSNIFSGEISRVFKTFEKSVFYGADAADLSDLSEALDLHDKSGPTGLSVPSGLLELPVYLSESQQDSDFQLLHLEKEQDRRERQKEVQQQMESRLSESEAQISQRIIEAAERKIRQFEEQNEILIEERVERLLETRWKERIVGVRTGRGGDLDQNVGSVQIQEDEERLYERIYDRIERAIRSEQRRMGR